MGQQGLLESAVRLGQDSIRRLQAAQDEVLRVQSSGLLFPDSLLVIERLQQMCSIQLETVKDALASVHSDFAEAQRETFVAVCGESLKVLHKVVPLLGAVMRSSSLRLAFELYDPLRRLKNLLFSESHALLLTSDWNYYPGTPVGHNLPLVVIGLSAIESSNALLIPLAGHEFAHNVWSDSTLAETIDSDVYQVTTKVIQQEYWDSFRTQSFGPVDAELNQHELTHDVAAQAIIVRLANEAVFQLEEYFCDAFGLLMFAESYLRAFSALCCPGVSSDRGRHPALSDRLNALVCFASGTGIACDRYRMDCVPVPAPETLAAQLIQRVVQQVVPTVQQIASDIATEKCIPRRDPQKVAAIARQFRSLVPAGGRNSLTDLINGAWEATEGPVPRDGSAMTSEDWRQLVNQMTLKSCEVTEYYERVLQ